MYIVGQEEIDALAKVIQIGQAVPLWRWQRVRPLRGALRRHLGVSQFALTASGTYALSAAMIAVGLGPGDEV